MSPSQRTGRAAALVAALLLVGVLLGTASAGTPATGDGQAPQAKSATKPSSYTGQTSQDKPVSLKASRRGVRFSLGWSAPCDDAGEPFAGTTFNSKPLRVRKGRLKVATSFTDEAVDGVAVGYEVTFKGKVRSRRARGRWQMVATGPSTTGGTYRCDTGAVKWSAKRRSKANSRQRREGAPRAANKLGLQTQTRSPGRRAPGDGGPAAPGPGGGPPAPGEGDASAGSPGISSLTGQVLYTARDCFRNAGGQTPAGYEAPLDTASLRLVPRSGSPVPPAKLDENGRFAAQLDPNQTYNAFAVLESQRVSVGPDTSPSLPYEIPLGPVTQSDQRFLIGGGTGDTTPDPAEGAANVFAVLQQGARVGAKAVPAVLPSIHARWRYKSDLTGWLGDIPQPPGTQYDSSSNSIVVAGRQDGGGRDEYERTVLLHEYGHHVLQTAAAPPDSASGDHGFASVHPENPGLPWSEGFAHAFAAIVTESAQQTQGCRTVLDLGAEPATAEKFGQIGVLEPMPPGPVSHLAQYNETATAGALWGLVGRLGGGDPQAGLKQALLAFNGFHRRHGGPESLREARDALTRDALTGEVGGLEQTAEEHQALTELFAGQRIGWAFGMELDASSDDGSGLDSLYVSADGPPPYGRCSTDGPRPQFGGFLRGANGALDYAWQDDCYIESEEGVGFSGPSNALYVPYPAPADPAGPDLAKTTVYARWQCEDDGFGDPCPSRRGFEIAIARGAFLSDPAETQMWGLETWGAFHIASASLANNVSTPIAEFNALGGCKSLLDGGKCE